MTKLNHSKVETVGERLKKLRTMTGATRKELHDKFNINSNSLQAWEVNRNPLSIKTAKKICNVFLGLGVICSEEWLLQGAGSAPIFIDSLTTNTESSASENLVEEEKIMKESSLFKSHYSDAKVIIVTDEAMMPIYEIGDHVGGFIYKKEEIKLASGQNSIITTEDNEVFFRKFIYLPDRSTYVLSAINPLDKSTVPLIYRDNIKSVAPVIWHRKKAL